MLTFVRDALLIVVTVTGALLRSRLLRLGFSRRSPFFLVGKFSG